jgi:hypothetical protein
MKPIRIMPKKQLKHSINQNKKNIELWWRHHFLF